MRRLATGLVFAALLLPAASRATTAPSLSDRIRIDGVLDDYATDELVLDATTALPESATDSKWGSDDDISRVALTWDHDYLYLAVEGRSFDSFLALFVSNRAGGLRTLEDAGSFRRAIEITGFAVNLIALAAAENVPGVARADDSHPFSLVDASALPRAVSGVRGGVVGFEMAVPWSLLSLANPVRVVTAITGEEGSGAGDAAPDASSEPDDDRFARAVLDRWFQIDADANGDGVADDGISPRTAGSVGPSASATGERSEPDAHLRIIKRAFAPDRGDALEAIFSVDSSGPVYASFAVYSLEGELIRRIADNLAVGVSSEVSVPWDGRDAAGAIVRGGTYIVAADWGYNRGEHSGREKVAVVVVR